MHICVVFCSVRLLLTDVNLLLTPGLDARDRSVWEVALLLSLSSGSFSVKGFAECKHLRPQSTVSLYPCLPLSIVYVEF